MRQNTLQITFALDPTLNTMQYDLPAIIASDAVDYTASCLITMRIWGEIDTGEIKFSEISTELFPGALSDFMGAYEINLSLEAIKEKLTFLQAIFGEYGFTDETVADYIKQAELQHERGLISARKECETEIAAKRLFYLIGEHRPDLFDNTEIDHLRISPKNENSDDSVEVYYVTTDKSQAKDLGKFLKEYHVDEIGIFEDDGYEDIDEDEYCMVFHFSEIDATGIDNFRQELSAILALSTTSIKSSPAQVKFTINAEPNWEYDFTEILTGKKDLTLKPVLRVCFFGIGDQPILEDLDFEQADDSSYLIDIYNPNEAAELVAQLKFSLPSLFGKFPDRFLNEIKQKYQAALDQSRFECEIEIAAKKLLHTLATQHSSWQIQFKHDEISLNVNEEYNEINLIWFNLGDSQAKKVHAWLSTNISAQVTFETIQIVSTIRKFIFAYDKNMAQHFIEAERLLKQPSSKPDKKRKMGQPVIEFNTFLPYAVKFECRVENKVVAPTMQAHLYFDSAVIKLAFVTALASIILARPNISESSLTVKELVNSNQICISTSSDDSFLESLYYLFTVKDEHSDDEENQLGELHEKILQRWFGLNELIQKICNDRGAPLLDSEINAVHSELETKLGLTIQVHARAAMKRRALEDIPQTIAPIDTHGLFSPKFKPIHSHTTNGKPHSGPINLSDENENYFSVRSSS